MEATDTPEATTAAPTGLEAFCAGLAAAELHLAGAGLTHTVIAQTLALHLAARITRNLARMVRGGVIVDVTGAIPAQVATRQARHTERVIDGLMRSAGPWLAKLDPEAAKAAPALLNAMSEVFEASQATRTAPPGEPPPPPP